MNKNVYEILHNLLYNIRKYCKTGTCFVTNINSKRLCKFSGFQTSNNNEQPVNAVLKKNSVALFRKRTIPTERPTLVGKVGSSFIRIESVARSAHRFPTAVNFLDPEPLLFHSSSSSVILTRLSGPHSRPTTSQKIWLAPGIEPRISDH
jgi:hypothetical protein